MKTKRAFLMAGVLALGLLCGCARTAPTVAETVKETAAAEPAETQPVTVVQTVDELLAAIAPGATIELAEGDFDLNTAADYGKETDSPYYSWVKYWDFGWRLTLDEVDDLTIRSTGGAQLLAKAGITLQNCDNVRLEGFALAAGEKLPFGEGIILAGCADATLSRITMTGYPECYCLNLCNRVNIEECQVTPEDGSAFEIQSCRDVVIAQCHITDWEQGIYAVSLNQCRNVLVRDSVVSGCRMGALLDCYHSQAVELRDCQFKDNQMVSGVFSLGETPKQLTLEGCQFSGNRFPQWLNVAAANPEQGVWMQDGAGNPLTEADLQKLQPEQGSLPQQKEVRVHTVDEFLEAIGPDTAIILEEEMYDLYQAEDYGKQGSDYYYWQETFDGYELAICNVENFSIRSADGETKSHTISAQPRYADVLHFSNCKYITLSGFTAGHTKEPGECVGGVLNFSNSTDLTVENCGLFGCGVLGIETEGVQNLTVKNCDIYECSWGGIDLWYSKNVAIDGCTFRDLGGEEIKCMDCENVTVNGVPR